MENFQGRVVEWVVACVGLYLADNRNVRNLRFLEEALELVQAGGLTSGRCHQIVDYVFSRPVGQLFQEVGGTATTLAALCSAYGLDLEKCGELELSRMWREIDAIKKKIAKKPTE